MERRKERKRERKKERKKGKKKESKKARKKERKEKKKRKKERGKQSKSKTKSNDCLGTSFLDIVDALLKKTQDSNNDFHQAKSHRKQKAKGKRQGKT